MTDDEFKSIQSAQGVVVSYPTRETLDVAEINSMYADSCQVGEIDEADLGIPDTAWERQARALDDAGIITFVGPA